MVVLVVLHLKIPKTNDKGPIGAEAIFAGLAELFRHRPTTLALEIAVRAGFLYFFVVCENQVVDLVRGQLFSQYPTMEIEKVDDYTKSFSPSTVITTLKMERPDAYPIKTYKELESDFRASLSGMATSVATNELVTMQLVIQPVNTQAVAYKFGELFRVPGEVHSAIIHPLRTSCNRNNMKNCTNPYFGPHFLSQQMLPAKANSLLLSLRHCLKCLIIPTLIH